VRQIFTNPTVAALALLLEPVARERLLRAKLEVSPWAHLSSESETYTVVHEPLSPETKGPFHELASDVDYERSDVEEDVEEDADDIVVRDDAAGRGNPFPLIGIQKAYFIGIQLSAHAGENEKAAAGSRSHAVQPIIFNEFETKDLDILRLESAWQRLIQRHDLLRAELTESGNLVVMDFERPRRRALSASFSGELLRGDGDSLGARRRSRTSSEAAATDLGARFKVAVVDLAGAGAAAVAAQRTHAISEPLRTDRWPMFECNAVKLEAGDGHTLWRLQVKMSLVLLDALSEMTLRRELELFYEQPVSALNESPHV
jgi:hypothetical protein